VGNCGKLVQNPLFIHRDLSAFIIDNQQLARYTTGLFKTLFFTNQKIRWEFIEEFENQSDDLIPIPGNNFVFKRGPCAENRWS
jgi:hypothetical protein